MYKRIRSAEMGRLAATPDRVAVGSHQSFLITYTAGPLGVQAGGRVRVLVPRFFSAPSLVANERGRSWAPGFVQIAGKPEGVALELAVEPPVFARNWMSIDIVVTVVSGQIEAGESIEIQYGGVLTRVVMPKLAGSMFGFEALVDPDGGQAGPHHGYTFAAARVEIATLPADPCRMEVFLPSRLDGEPEAALVVRKDAFHNCVSARHKPVGEHRLLASPDGRACRVEVVDRQLGLVATSNAAVAGTEAQLFWGDLHVHTRLSDDATAAGPAEAFAFARDCMGHDFSAVADHVGDIRADEWQELLEAVRQATEPGRFAAFPGFEFSGPGQNGRPARLDRNVYYENPDGAVLPADLGREGQQRVEAADLLRRSDMAQQLVIPHQHPGGDWDVPGRERMRLVEIYSHWGCFERRGSSRPFVMGDYRPGALVGEALAAGLRLGFVGGSDNHTACPGNDFLWPHGNYAGGLTAIWADELTPAGLWRALQERSCYATTRARIWLRVTVNDAPMGAELALASEREPRRIEVEAHGTCRIARITIVRNGEPWATIEPGNGDVIHTFLDDAPVREGASHFYYVRVEQDDGEMAWSSPVWIDAPA